MKGLLYILAALALIAAVIIVLTAPPPAVEMPPQVNDQAGANASENPMQPAAVTPATAAGPFPPSASHREIIAAPDGPMNQAQISGRPGDWQLAAPASDDNAALSWQAFPVSGSVNSLLRSTLGGVDAQRWFAAQWQRQADGAIQFREVEQRLHGGESAGGAIDEPLNAIVADGRWQLRDAQGVDLSSSHPALAASALDAARVIASLAQTFADSGQAPADASLPLAGNPHRLWPASGAAAGATTTWFLIAPSAATPLEPFIGDRYPATPDHWQDWHLEFSPEGQWRQASHLSGHAASTDQPGMYLRRIHLHWP